jgi:NAD dependent epimerase/dehydratase family enzyme
MVKVVISGASGYVGTHLSVFLQDVQNGNADPKYTIYKLVRKKNTSSSEIYWNPDTGCPFFQNFLLIITGEIDKVKLEEIRPDVFIHLSGEHVLGIWTEYKKKMLRDSRIKSTK